MSNPITAVVEWVTGLMTTLGAPGAGIAIALENLFPPLPSELFLPLAGFTASRGGMNLIAAIGWTTAGSVVGALALYGLGALLGRDRIRAVVNKLPLVDVSDVDRAEEWFDKHGSKVVFFGRMIPVFRSLISIPAGLERMPLPKFIGLTALGSLIWNTALIMAGFLLGEKWNVVEEYAGFVSTGILVATGVAIVWFVVSRLNKQGQDSNDRE
jgi:membrane protein DedA with SNARE-associated domain